MTQKAAYVETPDFSEEVATLFARHADAICHELCASVGSGSPSHPMLLRDVQNAAFVVAHSKTFRDLTAATISDVIVAGRYPLLVSDNGFPRRIRTDLYSPAERAIQAAVGAVEAAGADVALTDAVILLGKAKDRVADFVDAQLRLEASHAE